MKPNPVRRKRGLVTTERDKNAQSRRPTGADAANRGRRQNRPRGIWTAGGWLKIETSSSVSIWRLDSRLLHSQLLRLHSDLVRQRRLNQLDTENTTAGHNRLADLPPRAQPSVLR